MLQQRFVKSLAQQPLNITPGMARQSLTLYRQTKDGRSREPAVCPVVLPKWNLAYDGSAS